MADLPAVPARVVVGLDRHRQRAVLVGCGTRGCGVVFAELEGRSPAEGGAPHPHVVGYRPGFRRNDDGTVSLTARVAKDWRAAKARGLSWQQFLAMAPPLLAMAPPRDRAPYFRGSTGQRRNLGVLYNVRRTSRLDPAAPATDRHAGWRERIMAVVSLRCPSCGRVSTLAVPDRWKSYQACPTCQPEGAMPGAPTKVERRLAAWLGASPEDLVEILDADRRRERQRLHNT